MSDVRNKITSLVSDHPDVVILAFAVVVLFLCAITWLWAQQSARLKHQLSLVTQSRDSLAALLPRSPELERNPAGRALYSVSERGVRYEQDGPLGGAATASTPAPVSAPVAAATAVPARAGAPAAERIDPTSWALTEPSEKPGPAAAPPGDGGALWSAPAPRADAEPTPPPAVTPWPTEADDVPPAASWAVSEATPATPDLVNPFATMTFRPADRVATPASRTPLDDSAPIGIPAGTPSWSFVSGGGDPEPEPPVWPASSSTPATVSSKPGVAAHHPAESAPDAATEPDTEAAPAPKAAGERAADAVAAPPETSPAAAVSLEKGRPRAAASAELASAGDDDDGEAAAAPAGAVAAAPEPAAAPSDLVHAAAEPAAAQSDAVAETPEPAAVPADASAARPQGSAPAAEARTGDIAATAAAAAATGTGTGPTGPTAADPAGPAGEPAAGEAYDAWESLSRERSEEAPAAHAVPADDGAYAAWSAVTAKRPEPAPLAHLSVVEPAVPNGNGHDTAHEPLEHAWAAIPPSFPPGPIAAPAGSDAVHAADVILGEVTAEATMPPTEMDVASEPPAPTGEQAPTKGGILLVEDDANVAKIYRLVLESKGHTVRLAVDGVAALEEVRRSLPDLVLLDVMMPRMNGILFLQSLRAQTESRDVPVVILSNFREPRLVERAMALGAVEYVVKAQTRPDVLLSAIPRWMAGERAFSR